MRFQDLIAYRKSFSLAMQIFEISKGFPKEEKFSLTDQVRRSSRAVSAAIAESYGKRKYPKHFVSKLTDSERFGKFRNTKLAGICTSKRIY